MSSLTGKFYTYEEAKEAISKRLYEMELAPTQQEVDKMTKKVQHTVTVSCLIGAVVSMIIAIIISIFITTYKSIPIICGIGITLIFIVQWVLLDKDYFEGIFSKITSVFDKEYKDFLEAYKGVYCSKESYMDNIIRIIETTDVVQLEAQKKGFYKAEFEAKRINGLNKCWIDLHYYKGIDEEKCEPIYETQTITFL